MCVRARAVCECVCVDVYSIRTCWHPHEASSSVGTAGEERERRGGRESEGGDGGEGAREGGKGKFMEEQREVHVNKNVCSHIHVRNIARSSGSLPSLCVYVCTHTHTCTWNRSTDVYTHKYT